MHWHSHITPAKFAQSCCYRTCELESVTRPPRGPRVRGLRVGLQAPLLQERTSAERAPPHPRARLPGAHTQALQPGLRNRPTRMSKSSV